MGWTGRGYEYDEDPREEVFHERECCPYCGSDDYEDLYTRRNSGEVIGCDDCIRWGL